MALRENIESLQHPGSLAEGSAKKIPRTVRDAMSFVQILGERYLWVDTLCIVQDGEQKMADIANMGAIYAQASICIVAADGDNADSGLRGLSGLSGPRSVRQARHSLGHGTRLIETYGPRVPGHDSTWKSRAWTFQEFLFSRRMVIFEKGWIYWMCHEAIWDEYGDTSGSARRNFNKTVPDVVELSDIASDFCTKKLTYPEDTLFAFSGIASALSRFFEGGFVSGLPVSIFYIGLLWQPTSTVRRKSPKKMTEDTCLPSWSWGGWEGAISVLAVGTDYLKDSFKRSFRDSYERVFPLVEWSWTNELQASPNRIQQSWHNHKVNFWNRLETPCPPGWTRCLIEDPSAVPSWQKDNQPQLLARPLCFYKHESEPDSEFWFPPPMPHRNERMKPQIMARYIRCRTRRAWLLLGDEIVDPDREDRLHMVSLRDERGEWAGALQPCVSLGHGGEENSCRVGEKREPRLRLELVEIAQGSVPNDAENSKGISDSWLPEWMLDERPKRDDLYEYFYVLWIEWVEGIAYRKGLGRVYKNMWEKQALEWIDSVLG
ncbi:putative heterokaryon incompatibility protein [Rosellinia necatrix]|uniref:Putative heterokaryon incompatibility protein n=1 Tax=Rosellinia necatrix TaxID=77044 RepID=A0A1W2TJY4_ROSNE|nr:putative heterokaryon incompatibility protein [Rosellinia necatrix]